VSTAALRTDLIAIAETEIACLFTLFRAGFAHSSLDAGTAHNNPVLDLLLMRSDARDGRQTDDVLNKSVQVTELIRELYMEQTDHIILDLMADAFGIRTIVGDGCSSQFQGSHL
jgi:hypothetical protein